MTQDDMHKVMVIAGGADSGCGECVRGAVHEAMRLWPDFPWAAFEGDDANWQVQHWTVSSRGIEYQVDDSAELTKARKALAERVQNE